MPSVLNSLFRTDAIEEALRQYGECFSAAGSGNIRLSLKAAVPLDAQSDIAHLIPTMTRICGCVRMPFSGTVRGVTQVMFTERMSHFFTQALAAPRWTAPHSRYVEMDVVLEAGQSLLAHVWEALRKTDHEGPSVRFDAPIAEWGAVECLLEYALHQAVSRAYVITCDCDGDYVDELIVVQAGTPNNPGSVPVRKTP